MDYSFLKVSYFDRPDFLLDDDTAESLCCDDSNNCDKFYDVRPVDNCRRYNPILRSKLCYQLREDKGRRVHPPDMPYFTPGLSALGPLFMEAAG